MSLKHDLRCTTCGSRRIWHFARVSPGEFLVDRCFDSNAPYGEQEQYVCGACGLTESYALRLDEFREDPKRGVRLIDQN